MGQVGQSHSMEVGWHGVKSTDFRGRSPEFTLTDPGQDNYPFYASVFPSVK